jgi:hypothetical protein
VSFIRPWAMRYFVLDTALNELRYYEKDKLKCKGKLNLTGVQVFESKDTDKKFCFELHVEEDNGVLILSAQDEGTKETWTKAFSKLSNSEIRASILAPGGRASVCCSTLSCSSLFYSSSLSYSCLSGSLCLSSPPLPCLCRDQLPADARGLLPRPGEHTRPRQDYEVRHCRLVSE